ncbi:MAG TPA: histidine kinase [Ruminiclostridium sp.]
MFRNISFQKKMFIYYSFFIIILLFLLISIAYTYMSRTLQSQSIKSMEQNVDKVSTLLDTSIQELDRLCMQVYFNNDIQDIMLDALDFDKNQGNYFDYNIQNSNKIRNIFISNNFFKVFDQKISLFNDNSSFISSGEYQNTSLELKNQLNNSYWVSELSKDQNKSIILPPHTDWWSSDSPSLNISLIRNLIYTFNAGNKHLGYIEAQLPNTEIEKICKLDINSDLRVNVLNERGEVIYPVNKYNNSEISFYASLKDKSGLIIKDPFKGVKELVYTKHSEYTNWTVILTQPETSFMNSVYFFRNIFLIFGMLFAFVSLIIMYFISQRLTSPIREMRKQLSSLSLENPSIQLNDATNNEITIFNHTFNKTLSRMKESMEQAIEARSSESKAHFLALQAQMNPHFIYNILMVVSSAGFELGSKKIVVICTQLSDMMKYISAPDSMNITLKDELTHVTNYLELLKWRFEDQLQYEYLIDERLYSIQIPKLILQPLVENSYNHGFSGKRPPWNLKIRGWLEEDLWFIEIFDDGIGFSENNLEKIKNQITDYRKKFGAGKALSELTIGGMGLSNIYCRLYILYKDKLTFEINNNLDGITSVKLGGPLEIIQ